ncbi:hypothetical protein BJA5080_02310 [Bradyrhizobium diazoefficiens SEMIA 5080]|uniref:Uncharacterized protein n=1 Tax=Bradyrhizobium diazoefficiens SEMIA 5080 TaxID=754504 RepID=A0A837C9J8_9BRAD|nr:hypothetical protein BJA5080_02310 [Bradyrhizobium diazoefficiens SEMIA 5080]
MPDHATPSREALGRMLVHPFGKLRRAHHAGLHRNVGEVRRGDDLLVTIGGRGEAAKHGNDLDHDRFSTLPPPTARPIVVVSCRSLTGSAGGKMLS